MKKSLFDLKQDRLKLIARRYLAYSKYIEHDLEAQKQMRIMRNADNELHFLEFEIQKAEVEHSMKGSDTSWDMHKRGLAF